MIKEFSIDDFPKCCEVFMQTFNLPPWNDKWTFETATIYLKELVDHKRFVGYTLWENDVLIGAAFCHLRYNWRGDELCLDIMYISPDYQHKGYGSALLNSVVTYAKENACLVITLSTDTDTPAFKLYERFGFQMQSADSAYMHKWMK